MKTTFPLEKKKKTLKCNLLKLVKHIHYGHYEVYITQLLGLLVSFN